MKIAIVEDEKIHQEYLISMIESWAENREKNVTFKVFDSSESFIFAMEDESFDGVLLDIMMGEINGFKLGELIREKDREIPIAFITGEKEYVFQGYGIDACGYILKPIDQRDICRLMDKIWSKLETIDKFILLNSKEGIIKLYEREILYIESDNHSTIVVSSKGEHKSSEKMGWWEKELSTDEFFRTHRCYIVNIGSVDKMDKKNIYMKNGELIPIARGKKDSLMRFYMDYRRKDFI